MVQQTLIENLDWKIASRNFKFFYESILGYEAAWFHEEWFNLVSDNDRVLLEASRGCGKSTWLRAYTLWYALTHPKTDIIYFSHSKDLAKKHLYALKMEFDKGVLQKFRPDDKEDWTKETVTLPNGSRLMANSVGSAARGLRAHIVIADDLLSEHGTMSIQSISDWYFSVLSNIPMPDMPPSKIVCVGTPLTHYDIYSSLRRNEAYVCRKYPAIANDEETRGRYPKENDGYLWPSRRGKNFLEYKKLEVGELAFTREYLLSPISAENAVYPYHLIKKALDFGKDRGLWISGEPMPGYYYMGVDLAISEKEGADYTVITVVQKRDDEKLEVVYMKRGHFPKQVSKDEIRKAWHKFKVSTIVCEANAFQRAFTQELIAEGFPVKEFVMTEKSKHEIASYLRLQLENERLVIPSSEYMGEENLENVRILSEELGNISMEYSRAGNPKMKGLLAHDDSWVGLMLALEAAKFSNFNIVTVGEIKNQESPNSPFVIGTPTFWNSGIQSLLGRRRRIF